MTQVGVMMVESGEWRLLTTNRTHGSVYSLCWSRDATELFFDRYNGASMEIFRISQIGGEERLILENAAAPQILPDDSLIIARREEDRSLRLHRFRLTGHQLEPLNAMLDRLAFGVPYRLLHGGAEIVFLGWPADSTNQAASTWVLNLKSNHCELLNPRTPSPLHNWASSPYGPGLSDDSILGVEKLGDAFNIVSRKRDKYADSQILFTLTLAPMKLDVSVDGCVYFDQVERPVELLRSHGSNAVERIPLSASFQDPQVLPLPGGRLLLSSRLAGHDRLVVLDRGQETTPFLISKEESREPMARLGVDRVVCRVGTGSDWVVAIVSIADGSVLRQFKSIPADSSLKSLAGAPDGKTIYYVAEKTVWAVSVQGGNPKKIREGDGVAPYPQGDALLIQLNQPGGVRLVRVPLAGTSEEFLPTLPTPFRLVATALAPNAVGSDGRIALQVDSNSWVSGRPPSWTRKTGTTELVSEINADMPQPGWDDQGRVVVAAQFLRASIWRFSPETQEARK